MVYANMVPGHFIDRPNRFIAHVMIDNTIETVHVKNTGRCRELLPQNALVWCARSENPSRKTKFDLISVKKGNYIINMDSQVPNTVVEEWLKSGGFGKVDQITREKTHGDSRFDFFFYKDGKPCFMEVKGVTLESNGICSFPDAPTLRGTKHLKGLMQAIDEGFETYVLFVIQMSPVKFLVPNYDHDPLFSDTLKSASSHGVHILAYDCNVSAESIVLANPVPVKLD